MDYVLKTARNEDAAVVWQAVYVKGTKYLESALLNVDALKRALDVSDLLTVDIVEPTADHYADAFPTTEDFSYLLDYAPLTVGMTVYLEEGKHVVREISPGYRRAGHYPIREWFYKGDQLRSRAVRTYYVGHEVLRFTVEGSTELYVWENYNYQQSFLRELWS